MNEKKQNWYFTFGGNHEHPDGYVKLYGTFSKTREIMVSHFDKKWSMQYDERQFKNQVENYGLYEVPI